MRGLPMLVLVTHVSPRRRWWRNRGKRRRALAVSARSSAVAADISDVIPTQAAR